MVSFPFAPRGWALCNGQLLSIAQNQALFSILGTTYGGNGVTTFGLPDMRGRVPFHFGSNFVLGQRAGEEGHTLTTTEILPHSHTLQASLASANQGGTVTNNPGGNMLAAATTAVYTETSNTTMAASSVSNAGGSQPHENRQPYLTINFVVALVGIFPSRN